MADFSLFDTHCHIDFHQFDEDRDLVFERMEEEGVDRIIAVAVELDQVDRLTTLAESRANVWFSTGIHPNHEIQVEPTVNQLCALAQHERCVAIGETGMDFFRDFDADLQESRFRTHIRVAIELNKPVIVHMRDADEMTLKVLKEEGVEACGGIMHCFSSTWEAAQQAIDMGMSISFSGNITFKRNESLRDVARQVPEEFLLVETDAPYLAPMPFRGKRNEPTYVKYVAQCIADVKEISLQKLAAITTANALRRFGL